MTLVQLSTRFNGFASVVLRSPFHWMLSSSLILLTVTGRRTGRRYTIPVGYHETDDAIVVLVGEAPTKTWWRNYREPGPVEIRLRNRVRRGTAVVLPATTPEFRQRVEASFRRSRVIPRIFGIDFDRRTGLTDAQVTTLAPQAAAVKIVLDGS